MLRRLGDLLFRLRAFFGRGAADRELYEELESHLEMEAAALRAQGLSAEAAELEARRRFGSLSREAERTRDAWGTRLATEFLGDAGHALRQMRRRVGYTVMVVVTLGLGIGGTVALFSVVDDLLVRPLPYPGADRIQAFWMDYDWRGVEYDFVRERPGVFESLAAFSVDGSPYHPNVHGSDGARLLTYVVATSTLSDVLGTRPFLGRWFDAAEDRPGAPPVIVVSYGMWRQELGGDRDVIGHRVLLDGKPATVIGVMPKGFYFPTPDIRAWRPLRLDATTDSYQGSGYLTLVGRVGPGVAPARVQADVRRIARDLGRRFTYPEAWDKTKDAHVIPIRTYLLGDVRAPLLLLLAAVTLLLCIACANAAALILARTSDRTGEMAVRSALGAGRWRLGRQIAAESVVLALASALLGVGIAAAGLRILVARLPLGSGFGELVAPGWATVAAGLALALVIALAASAAPIRNLITGRTGAGLNRERSEAGLHRGTRRVHGALIVSQVALAVVLVVGATLLIRSVGRLRSLDLGFDPHGVSTFTLLASEGAPPAAERELFREILARVSALPGVTAAGLVNRLPLRDGGYQGPVGIEGRPDLEGPKRPNSLFRPVTPGFFRAMGMTLREGRGIEATDVEGSLPVAVISESFARRMWPGQSAIGKHVESGWSGTMRSLEVVGVVHETRLTSVAGEAPFAMFVPRAQQQPRPNGVLVVRSATPAAQLVPAVRRTITALDPQMAVARVQTMDDVVAAALAEPLRLRFFLTGFAALALVLGTVGVYGVVSYAVGRRRAEFAIRMALGASPRRVLGEVVRRGLLPVVAGVVLGLAASLALSGLLGRFLYGVGAGDPASLAAAAAVLLLAGLAAALVPALRAGRTSPGMALRSE